jgi:hypothetical protein
VTLYDAFGNVAANNEMPVALTLEGEVGSATLGGTTSVTPNNGVATFQNIFVTGLALGVRLEAQSGGLTQDSVPFNSIPLSAILPVVVAPQIYGPDPISSPVEGYVKGIYRTLLGRDADPAGLSYWVSQINGGTPRAAIIYSFWNSPENRGREVDTYYHIYLGRNAEQQGHDFWVDQLQRGADETAIVESFLLSPEELKASDPDFINRLYLGALSRNASQDEINYWVGQLQGGTTRQQITDAFVFSQEAAGVALDSYYGAYLNRSVDAQGRDFWAGRISSRQTSYASAAQALLASDEFFANAADAVA